jgi:hypothetical protein
MSCCFEKHDRLKYSLLVGGQILPRLIHAFYNYHPILWIFTFKSLQLTRCIRYISTWKSLLLFMMISTIFFDIYYSDDGTCGNLNNERSCLEIPSKILDGLAQCAWDQPRFQCSLRPPPSSITFIVIVAILTILIVLPFDLFFFFLLNGIRTRDPSRKLSNNLEVSYQDNSKDEIAINALLSALRYYGSGCDRLSTEQVDSVQLLHSKFGLYYDFKTNTPELTLLSSLRFKGIRSCVAYHICKSRQSARLIIENIHRYSDSKVVESYVLQQYILEHFGFISQLALKRQFSHDIIDLPLPIHPLVWLMAWLLVVGSLLFMSVWIILWSITRGSLSISQWGVNVAVNIFLEVFVISIIKIILIDILLIEILRYYLNNIHNKLLDECKEDDNKSETTDTSISTDPFQFASPARLAANHSFFDGYASIRKLRWLHSSSNFDDNFIDLDVDQRKNMSIISTDEITTSML